MGTAAALARESSGHHAALLVATGGIEALQAALDCLPRGEWGAFDLLVGTHAASAIGLVAQHLRHDSHDSHDSQPLWRDPEAQLQVGSPFHRTTCLTPACPNPNPNDTPNPNPPNDMSTLTGRRRLSPPLSLVRTSVV